MADSLSPEVLAAIVARTLAAEDRPEDRPVFSVQRDIFPNSRSIDRAGLGVAHVAVHDAASGVAHVAVHDAASGRSIELGMLVHARHVGPFDVRLVRVPRDAGSPGDDWRIVVARVRGDGVVVLTYGSGSAEARDVASRYAEEATEVDLASDFDPAAHHFGERRVSRRPVSCG